VEFIGLITFAITLFTSWQQVFLPITGFLPGNFGIKFKKNKMTLALTLLSYDFGYVFSRACLIAITLNRFTAVFLPIQHKTVRCE
jgi:hypothetical protein